MLWPGAKNGWEELERFEKFTRSLLFCAHQVDWTQPIPCSWVNAFYLERGSLVPSNMRRCQINVQFEYCNQCQVHALRSLYTRRLQRYSSSWSDQTHPRGVNDLNLKEDHLSYLIATSVKWTVWGVSKGSTIAFTRFTQPIPLGIPMASRVEWKVAPWCCQWEVYWD